MDSRRIRWLPRLAAATQLARCEAAVTALEYGLIAAAIAVVIIVSVQVLGVNVAAIFAQAAAAI
jgi:pilus assembly protein Flp/PilA